MHESYEEVHVTLADGRKIYWPKGDMARLAPAAVCNVASRMLWLRAWLRKLGAGALAGMSSVERRDLESLVNSPISFEREFLSGKSIDVHNGLRDLGESLTARLDEPPKVPAIDSAYLNLGTASSGCSAARDAWQRGDWNDATMLISNAIAQLESAKTKIYAHQECGSPSGDGADAHEP